MASGAVKGIFIRDAASADSQIFALEVGANGLRSGTRGKGGKFLPGGRSRFKRSISTLIGRRQIYVSCSSRRDFFHRGN